MRAHNNDHDGCSLHVHNFHDDHNNHHHNDHDLHYYNDGDNHTVPVPDNYYNSTPLQLPNNHHHTMRCHCIA